MPSLDATYADQTLTQSWLWPQIAAFIQPHDVIVAETGTTSFGLFFSRLPGDVTVVGQTYYGSIGYATPAVLGADVALRELRGGQAQPKGRAVLITGDGSLQLTMQEIGTMITVGAKPIIIILNNNGYTIERVIHGASQKYNDINFARYEYMLPFFGHKSPHTCYKKVVTQADFATVFHDEALMAPTDLVVIELMLEARDVPEPLIKQISMRGPSYKDYLIKEGFLAEDRVGVSG